MSEKIIAVAAGREITEKEFNDFVTRIPEQQQAFVQTEEGKRQALAQYANYFLFEKYGQDMQYDQSEEFQTMLEGVKRELLAQFTLTQMLKDVVPTQEEAKEFYEVNTQMFVQGAQATAKHILVDTEEAAAAAKAEIEAGEKTFEDVAKAISTCPSAAQGGSLGTFGRGQMVPEFDQAVFEGETGKVIGPVKTSFGYHLIWIDELTNESTMPYEAVEQQIMQQLAQQKQNEVYMAKRTEIIEKYGLEFK